MEFFPPYPSTPPPKSFRRLSSRLHMPTTNYGSTDYVNNYEENRAIQDHRDVDSPLKRRYSRLVRLRQHFSGDVDPEQASLPLTCYCFMTGFMDALTVSAVSVWCAFQTGNTVQLSIALARLFAASEIPGSPTTFQLTDQLTLTSISAFLVGAFLGRIGDKMGPKSRIWLFLGTMLQALCTVAAAVLVFQRRQSSFISESVKWSGSEGFAALAFASASMGLQSIMGKRTNTQFATTVVLTSVWCELMAEPALFKAKFVRSRDMKIIAVSAVFVGGFVGRSLMIRVGDVAALAIGTVLRVLIAFMWVWTPAKAGRVDRK